MPAFYLKWTQEAARHNRNTLAALNGKLGAEMEPQKGILLDYGSKF